MTGPPDPHDTEGAVDRLEEKVFGHTVDQTRDEDSETDGETADAGDRPTADDAQGTEPGAEPTA